MEVAVTDDRLLDRGRCRPDCGARRRPHWTARSATPSISAARFTNQRSTSSPVAGSGAPSTGRAWSRACDAASSRSRAGAAHGAWAMTARRGSPGTCGSTIHGSPTGLAAADATVASGTGTGYPEGGDEVEDRPLVLEGDVLTDVAEHPQRQGLPERLGELVAVQLPEPDERRHPVVRGRQRRHPLRAPTARDVLLDPAQRRRGDLGRLPRVARHEPEPYKRRCLLNTDVTNGALVDGGRETMGGWDRPRPSSSSCTGATSSSTVNGSRCSSLRPTDD